MVNSNPKHKVPKGAKRSNKWPTARKKFLAKNPQCSVCGSKKKLEVHHIRPFHLHPDLELNPKNFIVLCEDQDDGLNCHLAVGHLGNFKSFNVHVKKDAALWNKRIKNRPQPEKAKK